MSTLNWFSLNVFYPVFRNLFNFRQVGIEQVPKEENFVFVMNHAGALDVFFAPAAIVPFRKRPLRILLDTKVYNFPILNILFRQWNPIVLDTSSQESKSRSVGDAVRALGAGDDLLIFPEGSVNADGRWNLKTHTGAAKIALLAGKRVVPARISGSYRAWKFILYREPEAGAVAGIRGMHNPFSFNFRTPVRLSFGKPLDPKASAGRIDISRKSPKAKKLLDQITRNLMGRIERLPLLD